MEYVRAHKTEQHRAPQSRLAIERSVDVEDHGGNARTIATGQRHLVAACAREVRVGKRQLYSARQFPEAPAASAIDPPYRSWRRSTLACQSRRITAIPRKDRERPEPPGRSSPARPARRAGGRSS